MAVKREIQPVFSKEMRIAISRYFQENGISVSDFAKSHGIERQVIYDLINREVRAIRGERYRVAKLLKETILIAA